MQAAAVAVVTAFHLHVSVRNRNRGHGRLLLMNSLTGKDTAPFTSLLYSSWPTGALENLNL